MAFGLAIITVKVGTKITWKNNDGYSHTLTSDDGTIFDRGTLADSNKSILYSYNGRDL
jgi:plastocyanin